MKNDEQQVSAELVQTVVTLRQGMDAMYMLVMRHDEVLSEMKDRIENSVLLHVSKGA